MEFERLLLDPLVGWVWLAGLGAVAALIAAGALWRGAGLGGWLRAGAAAVLLAALANPSLQSEQRAALDDIVLVMADETASNRIAGRADQTQAAVAQITAQLAALGGIETRQIRLGDDPDDGGSRAMAALGQALADVPRARLAGVIVVGDGQVHDTPAAPDLPAPLHLVQTGTPAEWDRRLVVQTAPAFAIIGEPVRLDLRIDDQGAVPQVTPTIATLTVAFDGEPPERLRVPVGQDIEVALVLPHGGQNVLQLSIDDIDGELTDRNNSAVVQINGVRDRLRVLLVSGKPHAGQRVWRNLLKSDPAVDLVHFTILRPPEKQDGVPVTELSLIAFPTRELFIEKIDEFDLIIFDRYRRRGILPATYFTNMRDYVRKGGAILFAAGPEFGSAESLWRSPLSDIIPAAPTSRVIETPFQPVLSDLGKRHPVTAGLEAEAGPDGWGRWFRQIEIEATAGDVLMEGAEGRALLVLAREGEGRVALLASDQIWLWGRGYDGGGPQLELLRRLAHWTMKEPELEEDVLSASASGAGLIIRRRTLGDDPGPVRLTAPDGTEAQITLAPTAPGLWEGRAEGDDMGLYRLAQGDLQAVAALGPAAPREFEQTIASDAPLAPVLAATGGGAVRLSDGTPDIRRVAEGRVAAGRGWIGITPRAAHQVLDIRRTALLPPWAWLLMAAGLILAAWLHEGRPARRAEV